jgi:hypothetical protein
LYIVHSDVLGPVQVPSPDGYKYVIQFTDDFTRYTVVYGLRTKDEASVLQRFKEYHADICRPTGLKIAIFQADGAYRSAALQDYLAENHIRLQLCSPYSPGENGVAERGWLELANTARALMVSARAPPSMWMFAFEYAAYVKNRLPTSALGGIPPLLKWRPTAIIGPPTHVDPTKFVVFWSPGTIVKETRKAGKMNPKGKAVHFIGFDPVSNAYRCWDGHLPVIRSRHAVWDEAYVLGIDGRLGPIDCNLEIFDKAQISLPPGDLLSL